MCWPSEKIHVGVNLGHLLSNFYHNYEKTLKINPSSLLHIMTVYLNENKQPNTLHI